MQNKMNWRRVFEDSKNGTLYEYLQSIPKSEWNECDYDGENFVHYAARGENRKALLSLVKHGIDINKRNYIGNNASFITLIYVNVEIFELLCASSIEIGQRERSQLKPSFVLHQPHLRVLIANLWRFDDLDDLLNRFQNGILKARSAVVALLKLYKSYNTRLNRIGCKYMMQELVVAVWATRTDEDWQ